MDLTMQTAVTVRQALKHLRSINESMVEVFTEHSF